MRKKTNYWMIASIVFIVLTFIFATLCFTNYSYDFGNGIKIKKSTLDDFSKSMEDKPFQLCNMNNKNCMVIGKLNDGS